MSMRDLIHEEVEVDDEENDESFDEETGEPISGKSRINGELDDSSEEEEDDDDEEAARAVCLSEIHCCLPFADTLSGP
jgi:transcription elongation factor SPT6